MLNNYLKKNNRNFFTINKIILNEIQKIDFYFYITKKNSDILIEILYVCKLMIGYGWSNFYRKLYFLNFGRKFHLRIFS